MKVGVHGINLDLLRNKVGTSALKASGNNFGNMLFTNAVYQQVKHCEFISKGKGSDQYDAIVIPAANWINERSDYGQLADFLYKQNVPVSIVGLGAQFQKIDDIELMSDGTKRFLQVASELTTSIGVRGEFTKKVLGELGINNVSVLGCPSLFTHLSVPAIRSIEDASDVKLSLGGTRYILTKGNFNKKQDVQRKLYQFAVQTNSPMFYQSEDFEIKLMARENVEDKMQLASEYYSTSKDKLSKYLKDFGKYHTDINQWLIDSMKTDLYVGTRIHGVIASMLAGTPGVLISHDERTRELAGSMNIPCIDASEFDIDMLFDTKSFLNMFDFDAYKEKGTENLKGLKDLYTSNGLETYL
jgi:polysaccharide pyruvyl transferase WcaK-like protein